jgi:ABC-type nitrate/sulfonate/bicarbonate transport system substrate-binding protein
MGNSPRLRHVRRALSLALICIVGGIAPVGAATKLSVAKVADDFALVMVDFGNELGIFKRRGLDVDVTLITQAKMVQAVIAGSIDVALASGTTLAFPAKGVPLKGIAAIGGPPLLLVLVVRPDNSVTSIAQLKGRMAAVTNVGSLTDWAVSQIAVSQGWKPSDIPRVSVGDTPVRIATLKTKGADSAVMDIAAGFDLEARGEARILVRFGDLIENFQNQMVFASDDAIKNKRDAVKAFVDGWLETVNYAYTHKAETVAFTRTALRINEAVATRVYDELISKKYLSRDGAFNSRALAAMGKDLVDIKLLDKEQDLSKFVVTDFLPSKN